MPIIDDARRLWGTLPVQKRREMLERACSAGPILAPVQACLEWSDLPARDRIALTKFIRDNKMAEQE